MGHLYACDQIKPLKLPGVSHDPDAEEFYTFQYRPRPWESEKVYSEKVCGDVGERVAPSLDTGFLYEVVSAGKSNTVEPTWPTVSGQVITDGTIEWKAIPDTSNLRPNDVIAQSVWECDLASVTLSDDNIIGGITLVKVSTVPANEKEFTLTNRLTVNREFGETEIIDRSIRVSIGST